MKQKKDMKALRTLLFIALATLLAGCGSDDDESDIEFSAEFLEQTIWEGTNVITDNEGRIINSEGILMQFFTTSTAQYSSKREGTDYMETNKFTYSVEGRMMTTKGLVAELTLVEFSEYKMVFIAYNSYKRTITLTRKY